MVDIAEYRGWPKDWKTRPENYFGRYLHSSQRRERVGSKAEAYLAVAGRNALVTGHAEHILKRAGVSRKDFARMLGVNKASVDYWMGLQGHMCQQPNASNAAAVADLLQRIEDHLIRSMRIYD